MLIKMTPNSKGLIGNVVLVTLFVFFRNTCGEKMYENV